MNDPQLIKDILEQMIYLQIVCVALAIFLVGALILFGCFYISNKKHQKELLELGRYSTNVQAIIDENIPHILDAVIQDSFVDYQIMTLVPRDELYITEQREKEIREDLVEIVTKRISPMCLDKVGLFYNVHNIDGVIADKIYITVMDYVVKHNAVITAEGGSNNADERNRSLRV